VKATLLQGASVNPNGVHFVLRTGSQSIRLNAKRIDGNSSVATYEVPVFADKAGDKGAYLELSAVVSTGEGACSQQLVLGVAKVYALKREHFNVRLVPCHNVSIDEDAIAKKLNEIYKPLGKTFTVTEDELFYGDSAFAFIADTFDVKNISRRSTETEDMAFLKYIYREERGFSKDSVYLFVLPKANIDGVTGFMPRGKHVGYLFCGENETIDERTVAHELGHGLFTLEHAFDYIDGSPVGSTNNLMDYSDGTNLKVWQWNHMDTHGPVLPFFDDAEDAMSNCDFVDIYYWFGTKLNGLYPDYKERIVDNRMTYFDYVDGKIFKMSSSLGKQYGYTNKEGKCMQLPKSDEISEDWTVCYGRKIESVLSEIHKGNSVKLQEMKEQFIYIFVEHCDILGEDVFTEFALHVFKNSPTLSQYKVKSLDDLANNQRVKAAFQECAPYYFLISFFDENGDLSAVLQMTDILFYKGTGSYKDNAKKRSEEWVKHLLLENNKNNTNDGTANTEEYKEPQQQPDRYIVSDAQAVIRGENGKPLDGKPTISQGTEVKDVEFVTKTVEGKDVECAKVTLVGTESEQVLYTAASNLTKIEVLEKPEDIDMSISCCVELPYAGNPTKSQISAGIEDLKKIAVCGEYFRVTSSKLTEFGSAEDSKGYWTFDWEKKPHLTAKEIAKIRPQIAAIADKSKRENAYLKLQTKVEYHNQCDNKPSKDLKILPNKDPVVQTAYRMCNVTSLAMAFEMLGVSKNDFIGMYEKKTKKQIPDSEKCKDFEDVLDWVRYDQNYGNRVLVKAWQNLAKLCEIDSESITWNSSLKIVVCQNKVKEWLKEGYGVVVSLYSTAGHIVRLQDITEDGIIVDDPYGKINSMATRELTESGGYAGTSNASGVKNKGEDNTYTWSDLNMSIKTTISGNIETTKKHSEYSGPIAKEITQKDSLGKDTKKIVSYYYVRGAKIKFLVGFNKK